MNSAPAFARRAMLTRTISIFSKGQIFSAAHGDLIC
jgi:hypothetical protein